MPGELLWLAQLPQVFTPVVATLIERGTSGVLEAAQSVGDFGVAGRQSEVKITIFNGQPDRAAEFSERTVLAGGFLWHLYMKNEGAWKRRIGGGFFLTTVLYIYGPLCQVHGNPGPFAVQKKNIFQKRLQNASCGCLVSYRNPAKTALELTRKIRAAVAQDFGVRHWRSQTKPSAAK